MGFSAKLMIIFDKGAFMGGQGSGGWNRKYDSTTDDAIKLDIADLKKAGLCASPSTRKLTWSANGMLKLDLKVRREGSTISINDATYRGDLRFDDYRQKIELLERTTKKGGSFHLFKCPYCYKARRHLYLSEFFFICRTCAKLTYKSRRENCDLRLFRAWEKVSKKLGGIKFDEHWTMRKPKGMHAETFQELKQKISRLEHQIEFTMQAVTGEQLTRYAPRDCYLIAE